MRMRPFGRLIPASEARRRLLSAARPVRRTEEIPLVESAGRVAAREYRASEPVPSFARATWDGYAFRSRDSRNATRARPARLRLVGEVFAERAYDRPLGPGEAVAIATGGPLPAGADTVVIFEEAEVEGSELRIPRYVRARDRIAEPGEDFPRDARLVAAGEPLTPAALGALGAVGRTAVEVYARPRVAIVPNGNELVAPGTPLGRGQIYETNNLTLASVVRAAGGEPTTHAPVRDDPDAIEGAIRQALEMHDLVLVTGGSSVGERDYLPAVFPQLGRLLFHGIAVRPGKPTLAVDTGGTLVLGMPGHPTSCLANGYWLLLPLLRRLARLPGPGWTDGEVRLARGYEVPSADLSTVVPLRVAAGRGTPTFHGSSAITSLEGANAFALLPPRHPPLKRGVRLVAHFLPPPLAFVPGGPDGRLGN